MKKALTLFSITDRGKQVTDEVAHRIGLWVGNPGVTSFELGQSVRIVAFAKHVIRNQFSNKVGIVAIDSRQGLAKPESADAGQICDFDGRTLSSE